MHCTLSPFLFQVYCGHAERTDGEDPADRKFRERPQVWALVPSKYIMTCFRI